MLALYGVSFMLWQHFGEGLLKFFAAKKKHLGWGEEEIQIWV